MAINENDDFFQAGGVLDPLRPVKFYSVVNLAGRVEINPNVPINNSVHFMEVAGALPALPDATVGIIEGVVDSISASGTDANSSRFARSTYLTGTYSGATTTGALLAWNQVPGTYPNADVGANIGVAAQCSGTTTGGNAGVWAIALGGNQNFAVVGRAASPKANSVNIGVLGYATNGAAPAIEVGGFFALSSGNTYNSRSSALIAENSGHAYPIFVGRDNQVEVWSLEDGGSEQGKMGTKDLAENVATAFVRIAVPQGSLVGGIVKYTIEASDGTDFQAHSGLFPFAFANKAGTEVSGLGAATTDAFVETAGASTLTATFSTASNAADTLDIRANATSSLAQTVLRISYRVEMYSNAVVTVTPL